MLGPDVTPKVCFVGQTGPYAPVALRALLRRPGAFTCGLVIQGHRTLPGRSPHCLHAAQRPRALAKEHGDSLLQTARAAGLPVLQTCDINAPYVRRCVAKMGCVMLVCVGYYELLGPPLLASVRLALNAHPSLLPHWRGPAPLFWALRGGAAASGVTIHVMDARADHGPVVLQRPYVLLPRRSGEELHRAAGALAGAMLGDVLTQAALGGPAALCTRLQDETARDLAPRPQPRDVEIVPAAWSLTHLLNFACGAPYFRTPFLRLGDDMFFVRRGIEGALGASMPGSHMLWGDTLSVPCKDGIAHLQVQR